MPEVGASDLIPNVPTPKSKRGQAEVEPNDDEPGNTERPGGGKRLHVAKVVTKLAQLNVDIQSDNEEFAQRHRVFAPSTSASPSFAKSPTMSSELPLDVAIPHC